MRKLVLVSLLTLSTLGAAYLPVPAAAAIDCSIVLCAPCPLGTIWSPTPTECCRCITDCSMVLCAPCPDGTVHAPLPNQCCRCVLKQSNPYGPEQGSAMSPLQPKVDC